jgi:hypothetical protein
MAHLYKISEWETASGKWVCDDVEELTTSASKWYAPARVLGISPEDFVLLLIEKFKVSYINYYREQNFLVYWWNDRQACRDFKNYVNAVARKKQFIVGD